MTAAFPRRQPGLQDQDPRAAVTIEMFAACEQSGRPLQAPSRVLEVNADTIANGYEIWPTGRRGRRIGPKVLVVEVKRPA